MLIELVDDPWSFVDDARLAADLAFFDLLENEPLDLPSMPDDQRRGSVAEILALVDQLGPCGDAALLLESLSGRDLTQDEWLSVAQAWRPIQWWATGQGVAATAAFAGEQPEPTFHRRGRRRSARVRRGVRHRPRRGPRPGLHSSGTARHLRLDGDRSGHGPARTGSRLDLGRASCVTCPATRHCSRRLRCCGLRCAGR